MPNAGPHVYTVPVTEVTAAIAKLDAARTRVSEATRAFKAAVSLRGDVVTTKAVWETEMAAFDSALKELDTAYGVRRCDQCGWQLKADVGDGLCARCSATAEVGS